MTSTESTTRTGRGQSRQADVNGCRRRSRRLRIVLTAAGAAILLVSAAATSVVGQAVTLVAHQDLVIQREFSAIADVVVDRRGTIAVEQPRDATIWLFSETGEGPRVFGRHGAGPGEFGNPTNIGVNASGFWVFDPWISRVTRFQGNGHTIETFHNPVKIHGGPGPSPVSLFQSNILAVSTGDTLLVAATDPAQAASHPGLVSMGHAGHTYVTALPDGSIVHILARTPPRPECVVLGPARGEAATVPECADAITAASGDGTRIVVVQFDMAASNFTVAVVRNNGDTAFVRRIAARLVPIGERAADSIKARVLESFPDGAFAELYRKTVHLPGFYPPVTHVFVGRDGTVWLELAGAKPALTWHVLDSLGRDAATVSFPPSTRVMSADLHSAWGITTDSDGVQSVVRYTLTAAQIE